MRSRGLSLPPRLISMMAPPMRLFDASTPTESVFIGASARTVMSMRVSVGSTGSITIFVTLPMGMPPNSTWLPVLSPATEPSTRR